MNITRHAFERMLERNFTVEMLGKFLRQKRLRWSPTEKDGVSKITAEVDNQFWTLIVTDDLKTLITIRRAHEDEVQDAKEG
ncbi:hypothetical protein [Fibrobacter sp. UWB11]|uniref:hypothetical protein n=1 Tax=Fibrobacter sp. UWB11 TaxID=1896202 RepID=UPI0009284FAF|nr:hypothetical protein [Fibrobacter sp. UWB11]SIN84341.1 hypothetical protein SAMN05720758_0195 [Fibrobacter sp. UWB11]